MRVVLIVAACVCFVVAVVAILAVRSDARLALSLSAAVVGVVLAGLSTVFKRHDR